MELLVAPVNHSTRDLDLLSQLLFSREGICGPDVDPKALSPAAYEDSTLDAAYRLSISDLEQLGSLAASNHVIVRSFKPLRQILTIAGKSEEARWVSEALDTEKQRIRRGLRFLREICSELDAAGCPVTVIKSLDHWPDLGSDLDLYTGAEANRVAEVMKRRFDASLAERSWGDRLANKWNFVVPGLPELVEVHAGRLGQTGEQTAVTLSVVARSRWTDVSGCPFRVAAPEDRVVISTLQRMYRHFYIRLCDILDNANLLEKRLVDFEYLHRLGLRAGLWKGIATYLVIVSDYVAAYRGYGIDLPALVRDSATIGVKQVYFRRQFLRIPILPHSMTLYASELKDLLLQGELRNSLRLSLMPGLATAAALELKLTGSDKGIW
jgi:hypothetical protein